ncbi:MAG TPA: hypothetical protein VK815_09945 [Candidatus Acidoferrales bacterium]|nr:hypothetical protein [Candidatus Acidoferrales bacterium]
MRLANKALLGILVLLAFGCDRNGPPVQFILPENFRGIFQISVDKETGNEPGQTNGTLMIIVPTNGCVLVKDDGFLKRWHKETAIYPSGVKFSGEVYDTNALSLRSLLSDNGHTSWILIGTEEEFRIAISLTGQKLPLGRQLTTNDVPVYGNK